MTTLVCSESGTESHEVTPAAAVEVRVDEPVGEAVADQARKLGHDFIAVFHDPVAVEGWIDSVTKITKDEASRSDLLANVFRNLHTAAVEVATVRDRAAQLAATRERWAGEEERIVRAHHAAQHDRMKSL